MSSEDRIDNMRIEHASDLYGVGDELDEHFTKPWAMLVRVEGDVHLGDGEPMVETGEAIVRLANYAAHTVPEAFDGCPPINLAIGGPWVAMESREKLITILGGIMLGPKQARALGKALIAAADKVGTV